MHCTACKQFRLSALFSPSFQLLHALHARNSTGKQRKLRAHSSIYPLSCSSPRLLPSLAPLAFVTCPALDGVVVNAPALAIWEFSRSRLSAGARVGVPASSPVAVRQPLRLLRLLVVVFGAPRPSSSSSVADLLPLLQICCSHACLHGPSTSSVVSSACLSLVAR